MPENAGEEYAASRGVQVAAYPANLSEQGTRIVPVRQPEFGSHPVQNFPDGARSDKAQTVPVAFEQSLSIP